MDDQELETALRKMGKACFVRYYEHADDPALAQRIEEAESYSYNSCRTRVRHLRNIIRHGCGRDALENIAKSGKVDAEARTRADDLLARA